MTEEQLPRTSLEAATDVVKRFEPEEWGESADETTGSVVVWGKNYRFLCKYYPTSRAERGVSLWPVFLGVGDGEAAFVCSTNIVPPAHSDVYVDIAHTPHGTASGALIVSDFPGAVRSLQRGAYQGQNLVAVVAVPAFELHCAFGDYCVCAFTRKTSHFKMVVDLSVLLAAISGYDTHYDRAWVHTASRHGLEPKICTLEGRQWALFDVVRTSPKSASAKPVAKKRTAKNFDGKGSFTLDQLMKGKRQKKKEEEEEEKQKDAKEGQEKEQGGAQEKTAASTS